VESEEPGDRRETGPDERRQERLGIERSGEIEGKVWLFEQAGIL